MKVLAELLDSGRQRSQKVLAEEADVEREVVAFGIKRDLSVEKVVGKKKEKKKRKRKRKREKYKPTRGFLYSMMYSTIRWNPAAFLTFLCFSNENQP